MESSRYFIWVKRLVPLILIVAFWIGWESYQTAQFEKRAAYDSRIAAATANLYVGAVNFRADSLGYINYRDSVLNAYQLGPDDLTAYAEGAEIEPYRYRRYVELLGTMIDSIYQEQDSARKQLEPIIDSNAKPRI